MRSCFDLVEDDRVKCAGVDALHVHENIVAMMSKMLEDGPRDEGACLAAIVDKDGFMLLWHML